ncbi:MAG TPA: hypothetical protein VMR81_06720 [Patescibacteria group bacterium]|nr:hypothetical protein [Patescibacteria group bacterium]
MAHHIAKKKKSATKRASAQKKPTVKTEVPDMPAGAPVSVSPETTPVGTAKSPSNKISIIIPIIAVVFLLANIGLFLYLQYVTNKQNAPVATVPAPTQVTSTSPTPTHTPKPTPTPYPLAQGKISYNIGYSKTHTGPQINSITINPFDPKKGVQQTLSINVSATSPVLSADLALTTDTKTATYSMTKDSQDPTGNTWSATYTTDDTHLYVYSPQVTVKTATEKEVQTLTLRAY